MTNLPNIVSAIRTITTEKTGLETLARAFEGPLAEAFDDAVHTIKNITGRLIVTGMGKSGHIGSKIAATFASTGTPAFFVHPAEANHGDLGMIARDDAILAVSWSGESDELKGIIAYAKRFSIPLIAISSKADSALGKAATVNLCLPKEKEACPNGLAPTTSTIMQLATGDALAVALLESRGFSAEDFGVFHPGGSLGASLVHVSEIMHTGNEIPLVAGDTLMPHAIQELSRKRFGCVGIVSEDGQLVGIFTDGDLARNLDKDLRTLTVSELMTRNPKTVEPDILANSAMAMMDEFNISALIVVSEDKPVGILHIHDLLRIGVA